MTHQERIATLLLKVREEKTAPAAVETAFNGYFNLLSPLIRAGDLEGAESCLNELKRQGPMFGQAALQNTGIPITEQGKSKAKTT